MVFGLPIVVREARQVDARHERILGANRPSAVDRHRRAAANRRCAERPRRNSATDWARRKMPIARGSANASASTTTMFGIGSGRRTAVAVAAELLVEHRSGRRPRRSSEPPAAERRPCSAETSERTRLSITLAEMSQSQNGMPLRFEDAEIGDWPRGGQNSIHGSGESKRQGEKVSPQQPRLADQDGDRRRQHQPARESTPRGRGERTGPGRATRAIAARSWRRRPEAAARSTKRTSCCWPAMSEPGPSTPAAATPTTICDSNSRLANTAACGSQWPTSVRHRFAKFAAASAAAESPAENRSSRPGRLPPPRQRSSSRQVVRRACFGGLLGETADADGFLSPAPPFQGRLHAGR